MPSFKSVFVSAALAAAVSAKTVKITATDDNKFDPDSVEADKGDIIEFHFDAQNSSVVAGDYQYPCSPMEMGTGFFSGYVAEKDDKVFQVTLNSTDPIPFYSSQDDECPEGMVGIINPSKNKTLDDYKERASELSSGVEPGRTSFGGKLVDSDSASSDDDGSDDSGSDSKNDDDDDSAAGALRVSVAGLVGVVGLAVFMA